jgi:mono/diheme cytochrome c family protein
MSERLLATTLAFAIFLGAAASLGFGQPANNSAASTYKTNCVSCHGRDGRGSAVGRSLHAADFHSAQVQQQSDAQLADVVAEGRGNMPAFGTRLSKDQIDALVRYIRTLAKAQ